MNIDIDQRKQQIENRLLNMKGVIGPYIHGNAIIRPILPNLKHDYEVVCFLKSIIESVIFSKIKK